MDFPIFNIEAPIGTSIFQFQQEHKYASENYEELVKKFKQNLQKQIQEAENNVVEDEKDRDPQKTSKEVVIPEPNPGPNHTVCAICKVTFQNYYQHIGSPEHRRAVGSNNQEIFSRIAEEIQKVNQVYQQKLLQLKPVSQEAKPRHNEMLNNPEELSTAETDCQLKKPAQTSAKPPACIAIEISSDEGK